MKKLFFIIVSLSLCLPIFAQKNITGRIINSETKEKGAATAAPFEEP